MSSVRRTETLVHAVAVLAAFATLAAVSWLVRAYSLSTAVATAGAVVFNVLVFGGAHLYLAARGEDGTVTVESRWRFLAFLAVAAVAALAAIAFGGTLHDALGVGVRAVGVAFVAVAALSYLAVEARAGYRDAVTTRR
ncbi:hypothetical protein [Halorubellus salinus]|uniref:hypothetical protein n=1 Tax=Halorubellus salinus TaxID=755309 RepID=UPI001D064566|nr:hypothetical protein [Halorubellus salinus]